MEGAKKLKIHLPKPHQGQVIVRSQSLRFNWLSAGRRWRKTTLAAAIAVESCVRGKTIVWGAPTYSQAFVGFQEVLKAVGDVFGKNIQRMTFEFPQSGGKIIFRSLDNPDNARGLTADGVIIDEAGDVRPEAWYEVLRPMLMDTNGWLWAIGTPKGRNWFWREFVGAENRDDSICWQVPTVGCRVVGEELHRVPHPLENPDIDFEEILHIFETTPFSSFQQEIMAEFLENEGSVFKNISASTNSILSHTPEKHLGHSFVAGVDWGKRNDYTAISVGCRVCKEEVEIVRFNKIDYFYQREKIKEILERWGVSYALVEANSIGEPNYEMLRRDGVKVVPFDTTRKSKISLIQNMELSFERSAFQFQNKRFATAELEAFEQEILESGYIKYSAPSGFNDDTVVARALMLWANRVTTLPESQPKQKSKWDFGEAIKRWRDFNG